MSHFKTDLCGVAVHARLIQLSPEVGDIPHTSCDVPEKKSELENASRFDTSATRQEDGKQERYVRKHFFFFLTALPSQKSQQRDSDLFSQSSVTADI